MELLGIDAVDYYCLRASYPEISGHVEDAEGREWLVLADGRRVLYSAAPKSAAGGNSMGRSRAHSEVDQAVLRFPKEEWDVNVRESMAELYPLEPARPAAPPGVSPGRRRSTALLKALYGASEAEVRRNLRSATLLEQPLRLVFQAALALHKVDSTLTEIVRRQPALRTLLKPAGGFFWRRIAGEQRLSPHSFGIALDLSPEHAPYWRWSRQRPHPLQQSYPTALVAAFEEQGFIWGGKWHEYDLMHFEYRPEIICKARMLQRIEKAKRRPASEGAETEGQTFP